LFSRRGNFPPPGAPCVGGWRLVKTDITINGSWSDLERAMDRLAQGVDSLPTPNCAEQVATHFLH
jgi:transposase-like protein